MFNLANTVDEYAVVDPTGKMHLCWGPREPRTLSIYLQNGFKFVNKDNADKYFGDSETVNSLMSIDGRIVRGDNVLLEMPVAQYEALLDRWYAENRQQLHDAEEALEGRVDNLGYKHISAFRVHKEEYLEQRAHAKREGRPKVGWTG